MMWLINVATGKREYFDVSTSEATYNTPTPQYAIISHTWGDEELTFEDWNNLETAHRKKGFAKIEAILAKAATESFGFYWSTDKYVWIDTICIDRSNNIELTEAIRSMFWWYKKSSTCWVYLADVQDPHNIAKNLPQLKADYLVTPESTELEITANEFMKSFRNSRWFTSGWTLQELIAPRSISFFTREWKPILMEPLTNHYLNGPSDKKSLQKSLMELISTFTGIRYDILLGYPYVASCSIGERMTWMDGRETTIDEDAAYCMLGIFEVTMPLNYGEGRQAAFERLQEAIIMNSTDDSLIAWQWPENSGRISGRNPHLFAESYRVFSNFQAKALPYSHGPGIQIPWMPPCLTEVDSPNQDADDKPLHIRSSLTETGLSMKIELIPTMAPDYIFGVLNLHQRFRRTGVVYERELWCIPFKKVGEVFHRGPFPPGPIPIRTKREQVLQEIRIPRKKAEFREPRRPEYAFVVLFPDAKDGAGFELESLKQIGGATLSLRRSAVTIRRGSLRKRECAAILSVKRKSREVVVLYVGMRQVNDRIETAVNLFAPRERSCNHLEWHPANAVYFHEYQSAAPFWVVVNEGHCIDPLPGESGSTTIFTVSLYENPHEGIVEPSDSESGETTAPDSDSDDDVDSNHTTTSDESEGSQEYHEEGDSDVEMM